VLRERIAVRSDEMLKNGWVEETESLIRNGFLNSPTATQAIGYKIIAEFLSSEIDEDTMRTKIINSTRQYARRQESWFRNKHPEAVTVYL
jgi:tRNA dimethylallyltransferase